jgi:hypothetical protein
MSEISERRKEPCKPMVVMTMKKLMSKKMARMANSVNVLYLSGALSDPRPLSRPLRTVDT